MYKDEGFWKMKVDQEYIIRKHLNDAEQINMEIFKLWFASEGEQPVT